MKAGETILEIIAQIRNQGTKLQEFMNIPGNPTETTELDRLNTDLTEYDEAIKKQKHIRWLAGVEITRI